MEVAERHRLVHHEIVVLQHTSEALGLGGLTLQVANRLGDWVVGPPQSDGLLRRGWRGSGRDGRQIWSVVI